jgi:hypothetical protein
MRLRCALLFTVLASARTLAAQVGYPPEKSPYRDITSSQGFSLYGGYLAGSRGKIGLGPAGGPVGGVRYELSIGGPTDVVFGAGYGSLKRMIVDPGADTLTRTTGPVTQPMVLVEVGLNVLLSGRKTWHRLAPYIGANMGLAFGGKIAQDSSGFNFNSKFLVGPQLGVRWYPSQAITVRLEGRDLFWQIKYPSSFFATPARAPTQRPVLNTTTDPSSEWIQHPGLLLSIGFAFR